MNMYKSYLILGFVLVALFTSGCVQKENERDEEVRELVTSFIEAYNNGSAGKLYSMLSDDVKADYSVEDAQELVYRFGSDFTLNVTEFRLSGSKVVVNTTLNPHGEPEWALLTFQIAYNDSKPVINNSGVFYRIEEIEDFAISIQPTPSFYHSETYRKFIEYYNERNANGIYSLASEDVKKNHTIEEVRKELAFARNHSIKIISFSRPETPTISFNGNSPAKMPTVLVINGSKVNCSIKWVLYCETIKENLNNSSLSRITGYTTKMGDWAFEELKKCYNSTSTPDTELPAIKVNFSHYKDNETHSLEINNVGPAMINKSQAPSLYVEPPPGIHVFAYNEQERTPITHLPLDEEGDAIVTYIGFKKPETVPKKGEKILVVIDIVHNGDSLNTENETITWNLEWEPSKD
ncbi:MAG: hypothetical protein R6U44_10065 [Archaeoglobaceae archaeon]